MKTMDNRSTNNTENTENNSLLIMERLRDGNEAYCNYPAENTESPDKYPDYCRTIKIHDSNGGVKELVFPKALDLDRPKRARTTFSPEQLYQLEKEFQRNQYLVGKERTDLAKRLRLSETQVKVWFQNRRTKYKRDRTRDAEARDSKAESFAACNILRMLQHDTSSANITQCAPVNNLFAAAYHPFAYAGYSPP